MNAATTELQSDEPLLLLKINKRYRDGMTADEIYLVTRWCWRLNIPRARQAKYVLAVADGVVRGVFAPTRFERVPPDEAKRPTDIGRVYFDGSPVDSPYVGCTVDALRRRGEANPVRYYNL